MAVHLVGGMRLATPIIFIVCSVAMLGGCSKAKSVYLVNYRNEGMTVTIDSSPTQSDYVGAKSGALLSGRYVGGDLKVSVTGSTGRKEVLTITWDTMKANTLDDTIVILEVR